MLVSKNRTENLQNLTEKIQQIITGQKNKTLIYQRFTQPY